MKSKIAITIFALLFAVAFGAGGAFGIASLAGQLSGGWQARDWRAVPATVLDAALKESRGDDSTTYQVTARYRYDFNGRSYDGERVGFASGSDNVGSWHRDHYQHLIAARDAGRPIEVWVDPAAPGAAVIDRNIRWGLVAFSLPFATLFPMVSLGALWVMFRTLRTPARDIAAPPKLELNAVAIRSDARSGVRGLWVFATFWGLIAFPIAFLIVPETFGRSWVWLAVMIFPVIGVVLIWMAATHTIRLRRNGEVSIALSPAQPLLGDSVQVQASFQRPPPDGAYTISMLCEEVDDRGEDTRYKTVWRQERTVLVNGTSAAASFLPLAQLPSSQPPSGVYHRWRVLLNFPDAGDERRFDVVMNPAREGVSVAGDADDAMAAMSDVPARPVPESIATVVDEFSRLEISYNPANSRGSAFASLLFALIFGGAGGFMLSGNLGGLVPKMMGSIFAAVGLLLIGTGAYAFTHRRVVAIARERLRVANHWLLSSREEEFAVADIRRLVPGINGTTTIGSRRYDHHQIKALLQDGREIILASDIRDAGIALTLMRLLQRHAGMTGDHGMSTAADGSGRSQALPKTPGEEARAARMRNRAMLGAKIIGALMLLAFLWDFFGETIVGQEASKFENTDVEAP